MTEQHAKFSPSAAHKWMRCPGSLAMEKGIPNTTNDAADEGTATHFLASECLEGKRDPWEHEGATIYVVDGQPYWKSEDAPKDSEVETAWIVDQEMIEHVAGFIDLVKETAAEDKAQFFPERRVDFSEYVGVPDQFGTADAIVIREGVLTLIDLKYGYKEVSAQNNEQLQLYALGAINDFSLVYDIHTIKLCIYQPRIENYSEWELSYEDLMRFAKNAAQAVNLCNEAFEADDIEEHLNPGVEQCHFCLAKATCPALAKFAIEQIADDLEDLTNKEEVLEKFEEGVEEIEDAGENRLSIAMAAADLVDMWIKAVRGKVYEKLINGQPVDGFKLVRGRKGNRKWRDEQEIEDILVNSMKLKHADAYKRKVISPADAEKLLQKESPRRWNRLLEHIEQEDGKPVVASSDSTKEEYNPREDVIDDLGDLI